MALYLILKKTLRRVSDGAIDSRKAETPNSSSSTIHEALKHVSFSSLAAYYSFIYVRTDILPNMNQPVRAYPLRTVNEPGVFVAGEKSGQKSYPPGGPMQMHGGSAPSTMPTAPIGMPMNFSQQQALLAQQNSNLEALERRRERERAAMAQRSDPASGVSSRVFFLLYPRSDWRWRPAMKQRALPARVPEDDDSGGKSLGNLFSRPAQ